MGWREGLHGLGQAMMGFSQGATQMVRENKEEAREGRLDELNKLMQEAQIAGLTQGTEESKQRVEASKASIEIDFDRLDWDQHNANLNRRQEELDRKHGMRMLLEQIHSNKDLEEMRQEGRIDLETFKFLNQKDLGKYLQQLKSDAMKEGAELDLWRRARELGMAANAEVLVGLMKTRVQLDDAKTDKESIDWAQQLDDRIADLKRKVDEISIGPLTREEALRRAQEPPEPVVNPDPEAPIIDHELALRISRLAPVEQENYISENADTPEEARDIRRAIKAASVGTKPEITLFLKWRK